MTEMKVRLARYKLLSIFLASVLVAIFLGENDLFQNFLLNLGEWKYLGAFIAGIFFVSTLTVSTSIILAAFLAQEMNIFVLAIIGGIGAMVGDLLVYRFLKNNVDQELMLIFGTEGERYVKHVLKSRYIAWTLPFVGALIIASPLPDELGLGLLGFSKISETKLMIITFFSNAFGLLTIGAVAQAIK
jgi:hypothetical protein